WSSRRRHTSFSRDWSSDVCSSDLLALAATREIEVLGEVELFARALADLSTQGYMPRVLAVTGTNGKTTVTAMARQLVEASGLTRSEERRVGKEGAHRGWADADRQG